MVNLVLSKYNANSLITRYFCLMPESTPELKNDRFLRALWRQPVDRTPVWSMRWLVYTSDADDEGESGGM